MPGVVLFWLRILEVESSSMASLGAMRPLDVAIDRTNECCDVLRIRRSTSVKSEVELSTQEVRTGLRTPSKLLNLPQNRFLIASISAST